MVTIPQQSLDFEAAFRALDADHRPPLKWQTRLYERFVSSGGENVPGVCRLPTGLGKTSVIPIWLIALANGARLPRRLVYIVNRRTVVDQATDDASRILQRIECPAKASTFAGAARCLREDLARLAGDPSPTPLAVSTLRGELADNGEWKKNPARPAIIIGTVDMIGSKMLFSGYGDGRYGRAHHAGLIGQDALIVHDEAHLEPAFDELLASISNEQRRTGEARPIRVMRLSATARPGRSNGASGGGAGETSPASANSPPADVFELTPEDVQDSIVSRRLHAKKRLTIKGVSASDGAAAAERPEATDTVGEQPAEEGGKRKRKKAKTDLATTIAAAAFEHESEKCRVLVYVRTPDLAKKVSEGLAECLGLAPIGQKKDETAEQRAERERKNLEREEALKRRMSVLTGTIRGKERDELAESDVFRAFQAGADRSSPLPHSLYLISTSAGEVGADWDADHLVCDLSTLDSMVQRFGRVNRLGGTDHNGKDRSAQIVIVTEQAAKKEASGEEDGTESEGNEPHSKKKKTSRAANRYEAAVLKTSEMLREIARNGGDVSPAALDTFLQKLSDDDKKAAFSPVPTILPATDILFDDWSLTSISGEMPGRPEVSPYLHGVADWEPPETHVAWRTDIALLAAAGGKDEDEKDVPCSKDDLEEVFEAFPLRSAELLRDRTDRVQAALRTIADRLIEQARPRAVSPPEGVADSETSNDTSSAAEGDVTKAKGRPIDPNPWVVLMRAGSVEWVRLEEIAPADKDHAEGARRRLAFATVVLPVEAGGLKAGILDGNEPPPINARSLDVAEVARDGTPARQRVVVKSDDSRALLDGDIADGVTTARVTLASDDEDAEPERIEYRVAKGQEREPGRRVPLVHHNQAVSEAAERIGKALGLDERLVTALRIAGKWHDAGKSRAIWQRYANNSNGADPIAKSDRYGHWKQLAGYRHEFGSLHDAAAAVDIQLRDADTRDLVLHLIAAHHGWARPHFEPRHFDRGDPGSPRRTADNERLAVEAMQRFAQLQQRFGRWGLAWLETILRCADAAASESPAPSSNGTGASSKREGTPGGAA